MLDLMYSEGVIFKETENSETNTALVLRELRSTAYQDQFKMKKFGLVLQKFESTIQLGTDIVNDYGIRILE